jgi:hypothetical protein
MLDIRLIPPCDMFVPVQRHDAVNRIAGKYGVNSRPLAEEWVQTLLSNARNLKILIREQRLIKTKVFMGYLPRTGNMPIIYGCSTCRASVIKGNCSTLQSIKSFVGQSSKCVSSDGSNEAWLLDRMETI